MSKRNEWEREFKKNYGWKKDKSDEGDWETLDHLKTEGKSSAAKWSKKNKGDGKKGDGKVWKPKPPSTPPPEYVKREQSAEPSSSENPSISSQREHPCRKDRNADESRGRSRRRELSDDQRVLKSARTPSRHDG